MILFGIFNVFQIPLISSNSDVLLYSLRSKSDRPIVQYAFYEKTFHHGGIPLPNYHVAHTVFLWSIYQLVPKFVQNSIWPAGLLSSVAGALSVGLSFLIWIRLGVARERALIASVLYGLTPAIWHNTLIGEVYSLQYLFVFLFLYFFFHHKSGLSAFSFALANLVSPISGFAFSLIMIGKRTGKSFIQAILVGLLAVGMYLLMVTLLDINFLRAFDAISAAQHNLLWKGYKFSMILLLNIHLFFVFILRAPKTDGIKNPTSTLFLLLGTSPYLLMGFYDSQFLVEKGSFLSMLFWACALIIAQRVQFDNKSLKILIFCALANVVVYFLFWKMPDVQIAQARHDAARELHKSCLSHLKIVGSWSHAVGLIVERDGWDLRYLSDTFIDIPNPTEQDLLRLHQDSLLIVLFNREGWIARTSKRFFPTSLANLYDFKAGLVDGIVEEKVRNNYFIVCLWRRGDAPFDRTAPETWKNVK